MPKLPKQFGLIHKGKKKKRKRKGGAAGIFALGSHGASEGAGAGAAEEKGKKIEQAAGASIGATAATGHALRADGKRQLKKAQAMHLRALEEDASAFAYDDVYDQMKKEREASGGAVGAGCDGDGERERAQYLPEMLRKAKVREREREVALERVIQRDQEKDAHLYGDKEKFVTKAYSKVLEERKVEAEEKKREEEFERRNDARKKGFSKFHLNMLNRSVGSSKEETEEKPSEHVRGVVGGTASGSGEDRAQDGRKGEADRWEVKGVHQRRPIGSAWSEHDALALTAARAARELKEAAEAAAVKAEAAARVDRTMRKAKIEAARKRYFERVRATRASQ